MGWKKIEMVQFFLGGMIPLYTFIKLDKQSQLLGPSTQILGWTVEPGTQDFNHLEELVSSNFQGEGVFSVAKER